MTLNVTAFTGLGPGIHEVTVTSVERKVAKAGGDYLRWEFSDAQGNTTSANSSVEMTPGNKTGKWFAALTGKPTEVGQAREIAEVIGRPATIVLELNPEGFPKVLALTARTASPRRVSSLAEATAHAEAVHNDQERNEPTADDALPF
jgi:hypothetical protein